MKVFFRPFEWKKYDSDPENPERQFHVEAYAHNRDSEPVLIRIEDFTPFCYLELPDKEWTNADAIAIHGWFRKRMGQNAPVKCVLTRRKRLYYFRGTKTYPLLMMSFRTEEALRHAGNICKKPITVDGLPVMMLTPRETDVGSVKKLLAMRKCPYVGWMSAEAEELPIGDERRISSDNGFKHEYLISWRTLEPVPEQDCSLWSTSPLIMSWDIEVNSYNPKVFPNPLNVMDETIMIGITMQRLGQAGTRKHFILVFGPHDDVTGVEVRRFSTEMSLIAGFCDLITEKNPCILLGYNIIGFDYKFLNRRLLNVLQEWKPCTRIEGRKPELREMRWQSSAYGHQDLVYLQFDGRISVDLFPIISRDYKLDKYTLDHVSKHFLKKTKAPVEPKELFRYASIAHGYSFDAIREAARGDTLFPFLTDYRLHSDEAVKEVVDAFEGVERTGSDANGEERKEERKSVEVSVEERVLAVYRKYQSAVMTVVGKYCVQDTVLPIELFERLNCWINLGELAQIVKTTIMDTFTRGQQIRVFSQLYDYIYANGYYIDFRENPNLPYAGGFVYSPKAGLYEDVVSFDFASLYPSLILSGNICHSTFVGEGSNVPDEMCHIIEWDEEGGEAPTFEDVEGDQEAAPVAAVGTHHRYRFIKAEYRKGIFPQFVEHLLEKRAATREVMKNEVEGSLNYVILNARQAGLKVAANSAYGFLGVRKSKLGFIEAAMCITAMGRMNIHKIMERVKEAKGVQVYGDSVAADTPIPVRVKGQLRYIEIDQLCDFTHFTDTTEKQEVNPSEIEAWSDRGWTPIKRVIRHKVTKPMYRILTRTGVVDVTEDHSLLEPDGKEIRPIDVDVGTKLLHHRLPNIEEVECLLDAKEAYSRGVSYAESVSTWILSAPISIKDAFFQGYCDGNGRKTNGLIRFDRKEKVEAAVLFYVARSLGWGISLEEAGFILTKDDQCECATSIRSITPLPHREQWVYDLETENHHFAAGIGELIVHNTDSCMVRFPHVPRDQLYEYGKRIAAELSLTLPKPMKLEFEKGYSSFFILTAKRYACVVLRPDGTPETNVDKLYTRGIILSRRDSCVFLRELYKSVLLCIVYHKSFDEAVEIIIERLCQLMSHSVELRKLIIIKSINANYKSESNAMCLFGKRLKAMGKPVQGGDRLEYVFVKSEEQLQGFKMITPELLMEDPETYKLDSLYYMLKCFLNPIQQLVAIAYDAKSTFMKNLYRRFEAKAAVCAQIAEMGTKARAKKRFVIRRA